jgi:hypothetical protein
VKLEGKESNYSRTPFNKVLLHNARSDSIKRILYSVQKHSLVQDPSPSNPKSQEATLAPNKYKNSIFNVPNLAF